MARTAEVRTIMDESIDAPAEYDKQKLWAACDNGLWNGNNNQHAE